MLNNIDFATLLKYSPRGSSVVSRQSKAVKDNIKAGRLDRFDKRILEIYNENKESLFPFINDSVTLIATPRSSLARAGDLWPAHEICKMLSSLNLGITSTCLFRNKTIRKSSLNYSGDKRPSILEQYESFSVSDYVPNQNITLVDDVLTLGRTSIAAASRLAEKFPNATIRFLALIRTSGLHTNEIDKILDVQIGKIKYNPGTGKCTRDPVE